MSLDTERAEILKAKNMANKIIKDAEDRRKWIIDQADVHADDEMKKHTQILNAQYGSKIYDISPYEKDLQDHKKSDIEIARLEYTRHEMPTVEFLISHITNVKIELPRNVLAEYREKNNQK